MLRCLNSEVMRRYTSLGEKMEWKETKRCKIFWYWSLLQEKGNNLMLTLSICNKRGECVLVDTKPWNPISEGSCRMVKEGNFYPLLGKSMPMSLTKIEGVGGRLDPLVLIWVMDHGGDEVGSQVHNKKMAKGGNKSIKSGIIWDLRTAHIGFWRSWRWWGLNIKFSTRIQVERGSQVWSRR